MRPEDILRDYVIGEGQVRDALTVLLNEAVDLRANVARLQAALAEWRKHDSALDCVACAVLDAATCGALRVEDLLDGLPRLSTEGKP